MSQIEAISAPPPDGSNRVGRPAFFGRPRVGMGRQVLMGLLFSLLAGVIVVYWFVTDAPRVQEMAEQTLSRLIGGHVKVGKAHLSIFGGLRLDQVAVYVDQEMRSDSCIFTARTFLVKTDPAALLTGRLEPTQILALDPHVRLCENLDTGKWNYHRLSRKPQDEKPQEKPFKPPVLPEVLLRAGVLEYSRIVNGVHQPPRSMAIDGLLAPGDKPDTYGFDLDSRAPGQPVGPRLRGALDMGERMVTARLLDVEFSETIRVMLPSQVQQWWTHHQLSGRISVPWLEYRAARDGKPADFWVEINVDDVSLAIQPEELMTRREWEQLRLYRPGFMPAGMADFGLVGRSEFVQRVIQPQPIALKHVTGSFVFTPDRIWFSGVRGIRGRLENNLFQLRGEVGGYSLDAPFQVSVIGRDVVMPELPRYLGSIPSAAKKVYDRLKPAGRARFAVEMNREAPGSKLKVAGKVEVLDGAFEFDEFRYPLRRVSGTIAFGPDPATGEDRVDMIGLRGYGAEGTKNAEKAVTVDGWISPIDRGSGVEVRVRADDAWLDPYLRAAVPPEAREAMAVFDVHKADQTIVPVEMHGSFDARVSRAKGRKKKVHVDVDLKVDHASGTIKWFKYPMRHASGVIEVRSDHVDIRDFVARNADASLMIDGRVGFGKDRPVKPELRVAARNVPIDEDFLHALPEDERNWLRKLGIGGILNAEGTVFLPERPGARSEDVDFSLALEVRDGMVWPFQLDGRKQHALTNATSKIVVSRSKLMIESIRGRRDDAEVIGSGHVDWSGKHAEVRLNAVAEGLRLDRSSYAIVPEAARRSWTELRPEGMVNLGVAYTSAGGVSDYDLTIRPREVAITPTWFPWRMERVGGELRVTPRGVELKQIVAHHGNSVIKVEGTGPAAGAPGWKLKLSGERIVMSEELRQAAPVGFGEFLEAMSLNGVFSFECPRLWYGDVDAEGRPLDSKTQSSPAVVSVAGQARAPLDQFDFDAKLRLHGGSLDVGIPLTEVQGGMDFSMIVRGGDLYWMKGKVSAESMKMAGRTVTEFESPIVKPAGKGFYQFAQLRGKVAGGTLGGQVDLGVPKVGTSRYALNIVLKDADVREVTGEEAKDVRGRLDASLNLSGHWNDASKRQGRGDVRVEGRELYRVPVVLGLLQITNLSLPIKSPFHLGTASYSIQGHKVMFEHIELMARNMMMQGGGVLDFATKKVEMTFRTDNPNWPKIPLIGELIQGARNELFVIKVSGTIQAPQVGGKMMNTFSTTVDDVMRGKDEK